jgi:general secretion pathway protein J
MPSGFTLIELLVAITVLSLVSLISWRGLESLTATRIRLEPEANEIRAMLTTFGQMEVDLAQLANPAFITLPLQPISMREGGQGALEIVRFAPIESDQASAIQRVVYSLKDGQLSREVSTAVRSPGLLAQAPLSAAPLLSNVRMMQVRVWLAGQGWADANGGVAPTPDNPFAVPQGIEVTLERNDGTRVRRVMVTG